MRRVTAHINVIFLLFFFIATSIATSSYSSSAPAYKSKSCIGRKDSDAVNESMYSTPQTLSDYSGDDGEDEEERILSALARSDGKEQSLPHSSSSSSSSTSQSMLTGEEEDSSPSPDTDISDQFRSRRQDVQQARHRHDQDEARRTRRRRKSGERKSDRLKYGREVNLRHHLHSQQQQPQQEIESELPQQTTQDTGITRIKQTPIMEQRSSSTSPPTLIHLTSPWIRQFLASCYRDVLLPVPTDYLLDNFNLAQLAPVVEAIAQAHLDPSAGKMGDPEEGGNGDHAQSNAPNKTHPIYKQALRLIVQDEPVPKDLPLFLSRAAQTLYLLVHQRYVLSPRGIDMVRRRFLLKSPVDPIFGRCPSLRCHGMPLLPFGDSDNIHWDDASELSSVEKASSARAVYNDFRAKRYCCSCQQVYYHWDSKIDGCAWGPSFCHLFYMTCGEQVFRHATVTNPVTMNHSASSSSSSPAAAVPRIFGFRLHPSVVPCARLAGCVVTGHHD